MLNSSNLYLKFKVTLFFKFSLITLINVLYTLIYFDLLYRARIAQVCNDIQVKIGNFRRAINAKNIKSTRLTF